MVAATKNKKTSVKKKSNKEPGKLKKTAKRVVAKHSITAKKGIKKLVKKTIAKNSKATKKAIRKHAVSSNKRKKTVSQIEQQTKAMMKPFEDIAVAAIDAVDNAMQTLMQSATKRKKKS